MSANQPDKGNPMKRRTIIIWTIALAVLLGSSLGTPSAWAQDEWTVQLQNMEQLLFGVHFTDSNNGWAVGTFGSIYYSNDGGTTWDTKK